MQDPARAQEWLDVFEFTSGTPTPGVRAQLGTDRSTDRMTDYARITVPSLVIGFADDKMAPPVFGREVAATIPGARYVEIERCGHYGYLARRRLRSRSHRTCTANSGCHPIASLRGSLP